MQSVIEKAKTIKLLAMDVDGVLTDGSLYFGNSGEEIKAFSILDGLGIKLLRDAGIKPAIITGRSSELLKRRAAELKIELIYQGREDKLVALEELRRDLGLSFEEIAYAGDDLPDLSAICRAGLGITVANGHHYVARHADWQTKAAGGQGAIREVCELILKAQGKLNDALEQYL
ncbi:3-deoxy-D-manno-octulosonate 8-phosphate phosphatase KdsC [Zhongshania aliphaticivorans]|uniref:3-deoxy-D-manno-octulosonate 8-phosphate phosphatase KdsC n=1 Tax=Zhongshania aliphaticivorans TaxID=1470434 RepID=A0A5S9N194_9GAMM|nr:HAD family hydrolase [Zhongshania aliphaticivorans]CAA0083393.1 3-deoxy-D-manno-octulosonate 8-phosphate phosphatase KdsC [Zhongshania aliphaticivorans]CAA0083407.1 3-deoxy-D-manno-octulosonate 8-phosphate phosphatase KdsC [Zhongshania aliphaticivorans]